MTSTVLVEISRQDLLGLSTCPSVSITDVKHLSSYNWIEATTPTIAVPGSPSLWSVPSAPQQMKRDSGLIYIAQNAARHPDSPLEPLFRALYIANPSFDIRSIDVVTDRNVIRRLFSFINASSTQNRPETFTINIEVSKKTAIFSRSDVLTHEFIGPRDFRGFGHEFEKAYTSSQISGSTGHHRIISYCFGDLSFIVRYETDGYEEAGTKTPPSNKKEPESDNLSTMLGSLSLSSIKNPLNPTPIESKLTIKEEGKIIPFESILEIKTRANHKPLEIQEIAPQLWISQTFKLVRAYHYKGLFQIPEVEDVAAQIKKWEERNQTDLRKLAALVKKIIQVVKESCGKATVMYDASSDKLIIYKVERQNMLPEDLYSKWDDKEDSKAETGLVHAGSSIKPVDGVETDNIERESTVLGRGDTKGKKPAVAMKDGEPSLPKS